LNVLRLTKNEKNEKHLFSKINYIYNTTLQESGMYNSLHNDKSWRLIIVRYG